MSKFQGQDLSAIDIGALSPEDWAALKVEAARQAHLARSAALLRLIKRLRPRLARRAAEPVDGRAPLRHGGLPIGGRA